MHKFYYFRLARQLNEQYREQLLDYPARFRGSINSLSLISLKCYKPQLGLSGIQNIVQKQDFRIHDLFCKLDALECPKRPTPEKELQSWLLRCESRKGFLPMDENIRLVTDEFAGENNNGEGKKAVADILGFNVSTGSLVLIELKSERLLKELTEQLRITEADVLNNPSFYKELLVVHSFTWAETCPIEKIAIWPKAAVGKRFSNDIREFGYEKLNCSFELYES